MTTKVQKNKLSPTITVEEIVVSFGITANLGNYESARTDVSLKVSAKGQDYDKIHKLATEEVVRLMNRQADVLGDAAQKILAD